MKLEERVFHKTGISFAREESRKGHSGTNVTDVIFGVEVTPPPPTELQLKPVKQTNFQR